MVSDGVNGVRWSNASIVEPLGIGIITVLVPDRITGLRLVVLFASQK